VQCTKIAEEALKVDRSKALSRSMLKLTTMMGAIQVSNTMKKTLRSIQPSDLSALAVISCHFVSSQQQNTTQKTHMGGALSGAAMSYE